MTQTLVNNRSAEFVLRAGEVIVASGSGEAIFSAVGMQRQITFQAGIVQTLGPYDIDGDLIIRGFAGGLAYDVEGAPDRGSTESHIQIFGFSGLGQFLTAVLDHGFTATGYQWRRSLDGGLTYADIAGATGRIYQQTSADVVGSKIRVVPIGLSLSSSEFLIGAVVGGSLSISGTPVTTGSPSVPYAGFTVSGSGGTAPYTYSVASGSLPAGLTLNTSSGAVSGTPTTLGTSSGIVLRVTDSAGATADLAPFSIVIASAGAALSISGSPPTTGQVGTAYSFTPTAAGGTAPRTFSLAAGSLPAGLTLNSSTGAITGTPTTAGMSTGVTIRVTDAVAATADLASFSIAVSSATLTISGSPGTTATIGTAYSFTPTSTGGVAPKVFSIFAGTLPAGLSINSSTGAITGTPTTAGASVGIVIRVTDATSATANLAAFTLTVAADATPSFGYGLANPTGDASAFATIFASGTNLTGATSGGRTGSFNTASSVTNYTWVRVKASAASTTLRFFDGTGYGGFSGAKSTGIGAFGGVDEDPISTAFLAYTDSNGVLWNCYRSNGKASTFSGLSIL